MAFLLFTIISQCTISDQIQSLETSPVGFKIITRHLVVSNGYPTVAVSFSPPKKFLFLSRVVTVSTNFCSLPASSHRWFLPRGIQKSNWVIKHLQLLTNAVLIFYTTPSLSPMSTIRGKTKIQTKLLEASKQGQTGVQTEVPGILSTLPVKISSSRTDRFNPSLSTFFLYPIGIQLFPASDTASSMFTLCDSQAIIVDTFILCWTKPPDDREMGMTKEKALGKLFRCGGKLSKLLVRLQTACHNCFGFSQMVKIVRTLEVV